MSDFIDRMAKRILGEAPVVEPCPPGLYEPSEEPGVSAPVQVETDYAAPPGPAARKHLETATTAPRSEPAVRPAIPDPAPENTPARDLSAAPPPSSASSAPFGPPEPTRTAKTEGSQAPQSLDTAAGPHTESSAPVQLVARAAPTRAASVTRSALPTSRAVRPAAGPAQPDARVLPSVPTPLVPPPAASLGPALSRPAEPAHKTAIAPEPVVRISIGRVEVRANAAAPAPTPRPHRERRPGLSLEDYLAGGGKGGGRP